MTAANTTYYKTGDRLPIHTATLTETDPDTKITVAADVSWATGNPRFILRDTADGTVKVDAAGAWVNQAEATVSYSWDADDLDTEGNYATEWKVTAADGRTATFPGRDYDEIVVGLSANAT